MTGYGRADGTVAGRNVTVEVRCYNHRFKDIRLRLARGWLALEVPAEGLIRSWLGRGRVECAVRAVSGSTNLGKPALDMANAMEYLHLYRELAKEMWKETGTEEVPSLNLVSRAEGVVVFGEMLQDPDSAWAELKALLDTALAAADRMRLTEGIELGKEIDTRLSELEAILVKLREVLPGETRALADRMSERVQSLAGQVEVSKERLAQEIAVLAERMDITEELARMDSHLVQFRKLIGMDRPVGRELDFLLQEMNREVNTMSSKMHAAQAVNLAVSLKAEIEKIREQIQNVE